MQNRAKQIWFSRLLWYSARKWGELILQCFWDRMVSVIT